MSPRDFRVGPTAKMSGVIESACSKTVTTTKKVCYNRTAYSQVMKRALWDHIECPEGLGPKCTLGALG